MGKSNGRRLSKPQCINSSSSTLLDLSSQSLDNSSPLASSDTDYFGRVLADKTETKRRRKSQSRPRLRGYLYSTANNSVAEFSSEEEAEESSNHLTEVARKAKKRLSRSGSVFTQRSNAKDSTTHLNHSSSRLLDLKNEDHPDTVAQAIKERAQKDSEAADLHAMQPTDGGTISEALCPPVRRKSLYTPGLAKRNASDILRKPVGATPSSRKSDLSEADRNYYYNPSHPESSPLACLAALRLSDDGRATPNSFNVPNIGNIKLGSLVVTNGLGSPSCRSPSPSYIDAEEYHTASEGSILESRLKTSAVCTPKPSEPVLLVNEPSKQHSPDDETETPQLCEEDFDPSRAYMIAQEYMAEVGNGPFKDDVVDQAPSVSGASNRTRATQGISDRPAVAVNEEALWICDNPLNLLASHQGQVSHGAPEMVFPYDVNYMSRSKEQPQETIRDVEANNATDSGYHSNESVNEGDSQQKATVETDHALSEPPMPARYFSEDSITGKLRLNDQVSKGVPSQKLARRLQKIRVGPEPSLRDSMNFHSHHLSQVSIPRVPSAMAVRHAERLIDFPLLEHTFPSSGHTRICESPQFSRAQSAPVRFPSPMHGLGRPSAVNAGSCSEPSTSPAENGQMPGTTSIQSETGLNDTVRSTSWFGRSRQKPSKETRKLVKKAEEERRKQEKAEKERLKRSEQEKLEEEKRMRQQAGAPRPRPRSLSRIRGKSAERRVSQPDAETTIADFGTVAESLGCSPYDIATKMLPPTTPQGQRFCHPYQLSAGNRRPRSYVGMDDAEASELSRARSRLLLDHPQSRPASFYGISNLDKSRPIIRRSHSDWSGELRDQSDAHFSYSNSTPRSSESGRSATFNDRGGIPGRMLKTYSGVWDAPSVPSLPTEHGQAPLESGGAHSSSSVLDGAETDARMENMRSSRPTRPQHPNNYQSDPTVPAYQDSKEIDWAHQRQAWRQRRKSAGEALLTQTRETNELQSSLLEAQINMRDNALKTAKKPERPSVASMVGRFEGGLHYGFERAHGVGGSAGTRTLGDTASRKGTEISKGYGLDLSDLPVFVASCAR